MGQDNKKNKPVIEKDIIKYYFIMAGILIVELGLVFLFYLFATSMKIVFAVICLLLFIAGIVILIRNKYHEKIKIKPKEEVAYSYKKTAKLVVSVIAIAFGGLIVIKAIILLFVGLIG